MLLIGAGQLTEYLATMALFSGFAVTVCDPREEYRGAWSVAGATVVADMPDDVVAAFKPDRRSCVVALTHDPKLDDLALLEALKTDAFYVGAIGSRRNNDGAPPAHDRALRPDREGLKRLRGPIGIYIGSKTPPEIAVSVMAEILAVKNGVALPRDMDVAQAKNDWLSPRSCAGSTSTVCTAGSSGSPATVSQLGVSAPAPGCTPGSSRNNQCLHSTSGCSPHLALRTRYAQTGCR
jgi:hypothetical protein